MSKTPASPENAAQLTTLLEKSLEVEFLRGGTNQSRLGPDWTVQPFTLVGQSATADLGIEAEGSPPVRRGRGCGYILPEGARFRTLAQNNTAETYHWSHVRLRVLGEVDLFHFIEPPVLLPPTVGAELGAITRGLAGTQTPDGRTLIEVIAERRRLCSELLWLIVRQSRAREGAWQTFASISRVLPVLRFMRDQIGRPVLAEELSTLSGLSPSRLHAVFRAATGMPPQQYLMKLRLRAAQEQLISTQMSVGDVANQVGFRDAFHFSRMFKRATGLSPRAYRARMVSQAEGGWPHAKRGAGSR